MRRDESLRPEPRRHLLLLQRGVVVIGHQLVAEVHRLHRRGGAASVAAQDGGEGLPEVRVERVNDRVQGRVGPAEPHEDAESGVADARRGSRLVRVAERHHAVQDKKRQPAKHKHPHDDGQRL